MDREQFDALARLVSMKNSRRTALATLLGVALFSHESGDLPAKGSKRRRRVAFELGDRVTNQFAQFDIRDGRVLAPPALIPVPAYPVRVMNDEIQVGMSGTY